MNRYGGMLWFSCFFLSQGHWINFELFVHPIKRLDDQKSESCTIYLNVRIRLKATIPYLKSNRQCKTILIHSFPQAHIIFRTAQSSQWKKKWKHWWAWYIFVFWMQMNFYEWWCTCAHIHTIGIVHECVLCLHSFGEFVSCPTTISWWALWMLQFSSAGSIWSSIFFLASTVLVLFEWNYYLPHKFHAGWIRWCCVG